MSDVDESDTFEVLPRHPLEETEAITSTTTGAASTSVSAAPAEGSAATMLRDTENSKGNPLQLSTAAPPNGRSLDQFLEDAYQDHSLLNQWKYWLIMLSLGVSNSSDASEILCLSYILSDDQFEDRMLLDSDWRGGMLAAAVFLGMLMGGLIVGTLGDWRGRRPMLIWGLNLNMIAGILSSFANNVFILTFLRMIAGIGIGATVPPLFTLVTELAPPSQRGLCVTFCASFWMVGSVYVALMAILFLKKAEDGDKGNTSNEIAMQHHLLELVPWRIFALSCAVPSAAGAAMVYLLCPESPRYLALQKRFDEALSSANLLGSNLGYQGQSLYRWELEQQFGLACTSAANYHPSQAGDEGDGASFSSWSTTIRWVRMATADFVVSAGKLYTPSLIQTTWPLQMVWFSLSFGSYGLMTWINTLFFAVHLEDVYFNALLFALSNLPGNLMTAFLMDRAGRAQLLVGSILSASISLLSFALYASGDGTKPPNTYGIVLSACSFQCFTIAAWNTIDVMTSELFPTTVRSTGMGVCTASGRIGAMMAQFVNGFLVGRPVRLLVVASITLAMGATTPFLLPQRRDMTGQPVEDDFRGPVDEERQGILDGADLNESENSIQDGDNELQEGGKGSEQAPPSLGLSRRGNPTSTNASSYQRVHK